MPDSWRDYGVDFDKDGKVDLRNSTADAIGSVANFLKQKGGWQKGIDVMYAVQFDSKPNIAEALKLPVEPSKTIDELKQYGISSPESIPSSVKLSLIDLPNGDNPTQYVLGSRNFYAITRYNKSYMYAMSVYELGAAVKKSYDSGTTTTTATAATAAKKPAASNTTTPAKTKPAASSSKTNTPAKPAANSAKASNKTKVDNTAAKGVDPKAKPKK